MADNTSRVQLYFQTMSYARHYDPSLLSIKVRSKKPERTNTVGQLQRHYLRLVIGCWRVR